MRKNVLFPIETIAREFDFKLLLGSMYLQEGMNIYIGQHDHLYKASRYMSGGIYLGKNMFLRKSDGGWIDRCSKLKERGIRVIHLDEEGAVYWGEEQEWERRLSRRMDVGKISGKDFICTWGEFQKNYYQHVCDIDADQVQVTGHPRFDLIKGKYNWFYDDDVNEIKSRYGDFILIPTAFQWFNNPFGSSDSFSPRKGYYVEDVDSRKRYVGYWAYNGKAFADYVKMVMYISSDFPDINIVVRPHPSECIETYNNAFKSIKNVIINREYSVMPWILASKLLIVDGCTTAIEGNLSGTPVIIYQPIDEKEHDMFLPSVAGEKINEISMLMGKVKNILYEEGGVNIDEPSSNLRALKMFNNFSNDDSFEGVLSIMRRAEENREQDLLDDKFDYLGYMLFSAKEHMIDKVKMPVRRMMSGKYKEYLAYRNGFPGINNDYVRHKVNVISKKLDKKIGYKVYNENMMVLTG